MATRDQTGAAHEALSKSFPDAITTPNDSEWDAARYSFNLVIDQQPEAVARPRSADETGAIVRAARELGLRLHAQGSSHNPAPVGSLDGYLLVRFDRMKEVTIEPESETARVEAGARWWDVVPQASELGLSALHGSSPEVNVTGYSLGGGIGWQARHKGLQANSITALDVVTAAGEQLRVDADNESDLFWALRGGSGNFALVTALEFRLYPVESFYAGNLFFPFERGAEVLRAWHEWTHTLPEEATTTARLLQFPPLEEIPEIVRGKSFAVVNGAFLGSEEDGAELLAPMRELGPEMDGVGMVPPGALSEMHMDPVDPLPYLTAHSLVDDLTDAALDETAELAKNEPVPIVEFRHVGGALSRPAEGSGAIASVPGEFLTFAVIPVFDPSTVPQIKAGLSRFNGVFAANDIGRYLNFTEVETELETMFPPETIDRLRQVKDAYDPDGAIRGNHAVRAP
jgi:FAD/FMN-containing dehydrogenase